VAFYATFTPYSKSNQTCLETIQVLLLSWSDFNFYSAPDTVHLFEIFAGAAETTKYWLDTYAQFTKATPYESMLSPPDHYFHSV